MWKFKQLRPGFDWLIDFNGKSNLLGLFYTLVFREMWAESISHGDNRYAICASPILGRLALFLKIIQIGSECRFLLFNTDFAE